ncbi:MAG TPA: retropepsin-like aspartic protease [Defluviitoga tunisiensis]|nr:retropepsin-like aspartic protease [Defluviitoga tunisiensis]HPD24962.1 retropepsin-like aspartic protease [Bacteroidales bacterium]HPP10715.1 retropepsin-like aspartic protease [Defluviitoga tunisiensis]
MNKIRIYLSLILIILIPSVLACGRKSGRKSTINNNHGYHIEQKTNSFNTEKYDNAVKMESENGVKYIWIEINGIRLKFIFDTGASNICISSAEAAVLYRQGTLSRSDIIDVQHFQDATGRVSKGTRINLREVKIGKKVLHNIEAIIIDNYEAPLLLGQSALEKFGRISIDNQRGVIIFE